MKRTQIILASNIEDISKYSNMNIEQVCKEIENKNCSLMLKASLNDIKETLLTEHLCIIKLSNFTVFIEKEKPPKKIISNSKTKEEILRADIFTILREMGIPIHIKGFKYLLDAIVISASDSVKIENTMNEIYKVIGEANNVTAKSVERAISRALLVSIENCDENIFIELFGTKERLKKSKLMPAEAIKIIAEKIHVFM